jgi:ABC-type phosphate/phosphonate transport system substrate-binding protein
MTDAIARVTVIIIFTILPAIYLKYVKFKQEQLSNSFKKNLHDTFSNLFNNINENLINIDRIIDEKRELLKNILKENKISKEIFISLNNNINDYINSFRIEYLRFLFNDYDDLVITFNMMFADGKISQRELYLLFNDIKNNKNISTQQQKYLIDNITKHCIQNNKIIDSQNLFDNLNYGKIDKYKKKLILYFSIGLPVLILLLSLTWITRYKLGIKKADVTFGFISYTEKDKIQDLTGKIEKYISEQTGKDILINLYDYDEFDNICKDVTENKIQGFMINPGMYTTINEKKPEIITNYMELFARHQEGGNDTYKSAVITKKTYFESFCKKINKSLNYFNYKSLDDSAKFFISIYLREGKHAFTSKNSLSGYMIPVSYLLTEFNLIADETETKNKINILWSGDHSNSIKGVLEGNYHSASVYEGIIKEKYPNDMDKIFVLYMCPDIPHMSYWYRKDLDANVKDAIRNGFKSLDEDKSEKGIAVKKNPLNITGWKLCTNEEYFKMLEPSLNIIKSKLPKTLVIIENISTETEYHENLDDIIRTILDNLSEFNAWNFDTSNVANYIGEKYYFELNSFKDIDFKNQNFIRCRMRFNDKAKTVFAFHTDSLSGNRGKIAAAIIDNLLKYISPKVRINFDLKELFINRGKENGLNNCELLLNEGEIIPRNIYKIENTKTIFNVINKDDIEKYRDKIAFVKYKFSNN